jgi:hypothetical protein
MRHLVKWKLRAQPATVKHRAMPEQTVEVVMEDPAYETMRELRATVTDPARPMPEREAALNELHVLFEFHHFFASDFDLAPIDASRQIEIVDEVEVAAPEITDPEQLSITGRYHGNGATETETESGIAKEVENQGPLRIGGAGHRALSAFASGDRLTAYEASVRATGDFHAIRREATRLVVRGFLRKEGSLANPAPHGRPNVDAYRLTERGVLELRRLGRLPGGVRPV